MLLLTTDVTGQVWFFFYCGCCTSVRDYTRPAHSTYLTWHVGQTTWMHFIFLRSVKAPVTDLLHWSWGYYLTISPSGCVPGHPGLPCLKDLCPHQQRQGTFPLISWGTNAYFSRSFQGEQSYQRTRSAWGISCYTQRTLISAVWKSDHL